MEEKSRSRWVLCWLLVAGAIAAPHDMEDSTRHTEDDNACGGWRCVKPTQEEATRCDLSVYHIATDDDDGDDGMPSLHTPFKIVQRPGTVNREVFSKSAMLAEGANFQARVGYSDELVRNQGAGVRKVGLNDFVRETMQAQRFDDRGSALEREYLFQRGEMIPLFSGEMDQLFASFLERFGWRNNSTEHFIMIGGETSAIAWHRHAAALQINIFGYKRWLLYPAHKTPAGGATGGWALSDWLQNVKPTLIEDDAPLECIIGPEEGIYGESQTNTTPECYALLFNCLSILCDINKHR